MALRIPIYENKVNRITPSVPEKHELRPPESAFGGMTAEALKNLGETGQKIANVMIQHGLRVAQEKEDMEVLNRETAFRQDLQSRLFNSESETVNVNGQDVQRPKGLLVRELGQADGITIEGDTAYSKMKEQYFKGLTEYQYNKLAPALEKYYTSVRENLLQHEAGQYKANLKNIVDSNIMQKIKDASAIRDGKSLILSIDDAVNSASPYHNRLDPATKKIMDDDVAGKIIKSAVLSTQENSGLLPAQKLLNDVKDRIPQSQFDDLSKEIQINAEQATKRAQFQQMIAQNNTESGLVDKYFQNQLTRDEVKDLHFKKQISDGFAQAMMNNLNSLDKINAKTKDSTFNKIVDDILDLKKKPEDIIYDLLGKNSSGELSDEDFKILYTFHKTMTSETLDTALPKQKHLWGLVSWGTDNTSHPEVKTRMFKNYMQRISKGEDPEIAVSNVIRKEVLNQHPQAASYPKEGKRVIDINGIIKRILPTGDIEDAD